MKKNQRPIKRYLFVLLFKLRLSNNLATLRLDNKYLDPPDRSTPVENEIENEQRIKSK